MCEFRYKKTASFRSHGNGRCPPNNIQSCIGKAKLEANNIDIRDDSQAEVKSIIKCVQNIAGSSSTNTKTTSSTSKSKSKSKSKDDDDDDDNTMLIIGIVFGFIVVLIFLAIAFSM